MRAPRLADVAAYAGVSESTVSRVLNGKPGVSARNERAVLTALDVLGYARPARLQRGPAGLVGLVVPELTNPIFPAFVQEIEQHLASAGQTPLLCGQAPGGVPEDEYVEMLLDRGVAGIIFISGLHADSSQDEGRYCRLRQRGLPFVLVNGPLESLDAPTLSTDDVRGTAAAVQHLASLGHTRIGLLTGPRRFRPVQRKIEGYRSGMTQCLPDTSERDLADWNLDTFFTVEGGSSGAAALVAKGVTGIICASDLMALGAVRAVRDRGMRVPEDVSIVGYDDTALIAFTDPPLTSLRQPVRAMSESVVTALQAEIAGQMTFRGEHLFVPELVVRRSTGRAPA